MGSLPKTVFLTDFSCAASRLMKACRAKGHAASAAPQGLTQSAQESGRVMFCGLVLLPGLALLCGWPSWISNLDSKPE